MPLLAESKRSAALRAKRVASPTANRSTRLGKGSSSVSSPSSCVFCRTHFASKSKAPLVTTIATHGSPTLPSNTTIATSSSPMSPLSRAAAGAQQTFFGLEGRSDRVLSMHFTPFARITRCGHLICYPCAVAHGATTGRNDCEGLQPSVTVCPCCLRESSVDICRKIVEPADTDADTLYVPHRALERREVEQQSMDYPKAIKIATIEELRSRYLALRAQQSERTIEPISILKKDGYRTPETKGRCAFSMSPMRTPSTEPMGATPLTNSPAMTVAHSPRVEESPTPVYILESSENDLQLPIVRNCSFTASNFKRHSFIGNGRGSLSLSDSSVKARTNICPSPFDLIFLSNLHPKKFQTLGRHETDTIETLQANEPHVSHLEEDDRSTTIATSSSPLTSLISPRRDMSRDSAMVRRLARMQLWIGELQGDGPSPSLCTSARSHRSMTSARSDRSMDMPQMVMRSVSDRCAIEGSEDTAVPVIVQEVEEMICDVPFPCK